MPIYQYRCKDCGREQEALQKMQEPPLVQCDACQQPSLEKCLTAPSVRLSGGGYYETDEKPKAKQRHIATSSNESPCQESACKVKDCQVTTSHNGG